MSFEFEGYGAKLHKILLCSLLLSFIMATICSISIFCSIRDNKPAKPYCQRFYQTFAHHLTEIFEKTEELYTLSTVIEKVDTIAAEGQDTIFDTTWTEVKKLDGLGIGITTDDAGNIIVNTNFPNAPSSYRL